MREKYASSKDRSHIAIYIESFEVDYGGLVKRHGGYWRPVCGIPYRQSKAFRLSDEPEQPLCRRCQHLREQKDRQESVGHECHQ